jgi:hypothetical protein
MRKNQKAIVKTGDKSRQVRKPSKRNKAAILKDRKEFLAVIHR